MMNSQREVWTERGVYRADRAAALAGVPKSTLYYWAREEIYEPSVSPEREKLWSYLDLLAIRAIYWLRKDKERASRTSMHRVREMLDAVRRDGIPLWPLRLVVDTSGRVFLGSDESDRLQTTYGQSVMEEPLQQLNLLTEFEHAGLRGPDLTKPRRHLRIIPGKLSGEPHVENTRIATPQIAGLARQGFTVREIRDLYPVLLPQKEAIVEAIDLERQLASNLRQVA